MSDKPELTFDQFSQMCEDAGIQAKPEELEQDYRTGAVLADVVDEVMNEMETNPPFEVAKEGLNALEHALDAFGDAVEDEPRDPTEMRKVAVQIAALAIRVAADLCHDEAAQN